MSDELQKLKNRKRKIQERIEKLSDDGYQIRQKYRNALDNGDEESSSRYYDEMLQITDAIYKYYDTIEEIDNKIKLSLPPVKVGELVDLRTSDRHSEFAIYLHGKSIKIGKIDYRDYHCNEYLGDIGCSIDKQYRNHGYATEALSLLNEKLYEEGIPDSWITTRDDNMSSIRIIEKNGGELLKKEKGVYLYKVPTKLRNSDKISEHKTK